MCQAIDEPLITLEAYLINANEVIANEYMFSLFWDFYVVSSQRLTCTIISYN